MLYGINVSIPSVRKDGIIDLAGICGTGGQILERKPGETFREQVEILRALNRDVVRLFDLGDGSELFVAELPGDMSDDVICTRGPRSASIVCPNQLQRTIKLSPEVANGHWVSDAELGVVN